MPAPQELLDATTFKFGFGAATGGATDVHEVWGLGIETAEPVPTTSSSTTAPADSSTSSTTVTSGFAGTSSTPVANPRYAG